MSSHLQAFLEAAPIPQISRNQYRHILCPHRNPPRPSVRDRPARQLPIARIRRGPKPNPTIPTTLYDAEPIRDINFELFDFASLRDRVVLIVNVASEDGYTHCNYKAFADLLEKYHDDGLEIVVFPSNWYGQHETGTFEEIKAFVGEYSDRIKIMSKASIEWNPVFALGRRYFPGEVIWNFHGKFLFGRKGLPVARFDLLTTDEYLETEVSHFLQSGDPSIHMTPTPSEESDRTDDDWEAGQLRQIEADVAARDLELELEAEAFAKAGDADTEAEEEMDTAAEEDTDADVNDSAGAGKKTKVKAARETRAKRIAEEEEEDDIGADIDPGMDEDIDVFLQPDDDMDDASEPEVRTDGKIREVREIASEGESESAPARQVVQQPE